MTQIIDSPSSLLSLTEFRAWLEGKDKDEEVGRAARAYTCPIAYFLKEAKGAQSPAVCSRFITYKDYPCRIYTPRWVKQFLPIIDDVPSDSPITAAQALAALEAIE